MFSLGALPLFAKSPRRLRTGPAIPKRPAGSPPALSSQRYQSLVSFCVTPFRMHNAKPTAAAFWGPVQFVVMAKFLSYQLFDILSLSLDKFHPFALFQQSNCCLSIHLEPIPIEPLSLDIALGLNFSHLSECLYL
jgi:hypothetical protein